MRFWLSFVDPARPEGERLLGVCIVHGADIVTAARAAHAAGCNPGGEVAGHPIDEDAAARLSFPLPEWELIGPDDARALADRIAGELGS